MPKLLRTLCGACVPLALVACSSYSPAPLEPTDLLQELRNAEPLASQAATLDPLAATIFALQHNPELRAVRQSLDVADSYLLQAGVWPDINVGWSAMDWLIGNTRDDAITGLSLGVPLFRPDERDALLADAEASRDLVRAQLVDAEWRLGRMVIHQYLQLATAEKQLQLAKESQRLAANTAAFLRQSLTAGAATRFDLEMATMQEGRANHRLQAAQREATTARLQLNALLGAQLDSRYATFSLSDFESYWPTLEVDNAEALVDLALTQRHEVLASQALYAQAEATLRLASARQWPGLEIGTGISLNIPLFSGFNKRAVATAKLQRKQAAAQLDAAIASVRNEAWYVFEQAASRSQEWLSFRDQVIPSLEASLALSEKARKLGSLSHLEVLFAQRQLNDARRESIAVFAACLLAQADLAWFLGADANLRNIDR